MKLSIVAPCFNEEEGLAEFYQRTRDAIRSARIRNFEIILVDDGSVDKTWHEIQQLHLRDQRVRGIKLSRNFGHQAALTAGLEEAQGDFILIIDSDLQDPPELLSEMLNKAAEGYDVVYGQRRIRHGESWFKKWSAGVFYRTLTQLADIPIPQDTGDFRLISRPVLQAYRALSESHRFTRGLIAWLGFRQSAIIYDRQPRFAGTTKYPLLKMINFSLDAMTGFSLKPLRLIMFMGLLTAGCALLTLGYALYEWTISRTVPGWTSLMTVILLLSCVQLISLGVVGEYVGRTFTEAKRRPLYFVQQRTGDVYLTQHLLRSHLEHEYQ